MNPRARLPGIYGTALLLPLCLVLLSSAAWTQGRPSSDSTERAPGDPGDYSPRSDPGGIHGEAPKPPESTPATESGGERHRDTDRSRSTTEQAWLSWWNLNRLAYKKPISESQILTGSVPVHLRDPQWRMASRDLMRNDVRRLLKRSLDDSDGAVRGAALLALARMGEAETEALLRGLADPLRRVRDQAELALALADGRARYYLLHMAADLEEARRHTLDRDDPRRVRAIAALFLSLHDPRSLTTLMRDFIEDSDAIPTRFQALAIEALGIAAAKDAAPLLLGIATDRARSAVVRCAAVDALGRMNASDTAASLLELLAERDCPADVRQATALAMGSLLKEEDRTLLRAVQQTADRDSHAMVRRACLFTLGEIGGTANEWILSRRIQKCRGEERCYVALALGLAARRSPSDESLHLLIEILGESHSVEERMATAAALGLSAASAAIDPLCGVLRAEPAPSVRKIAAEALGLLGHASAIPALHEVMKTDLPPDLFAAAAEALGRLDPMASSFLMKLFVDPRHQTALDRESLFLAMGQSQDPPAISLIVDWLNQQPGAAGRERAAAFAALGMIYDGRGTDLTAAFGYRVNWARFPTELWPLLSLVP